VTKSELRDLWASRVAEFKSSGKSVPVWCVANGVSIHQMRYWLRKEQTSASKAISWVPIDISNAGLQGFLLVRVGQVAVEVKPGFDPKLLLDVLRTLAVL